MRTVLSAHEAPAEIYERYGLREAGGEAERMNEKDAGVEAEGTGDPVTESG